MRRPARKSEVPDYVREVLDHSGVAWTVERGSRHLILRVAGRVVQVVPVASREPARSRAGRNAVASLRRAVRERRDVGQ